MATWGPIIVLMAASINWLHGGMRDATLVAQAKMATEKEKQQSKVEDKTANQAPVSRLWGRPARPARPSVCTRSCAWGVER